jgi:hypothetical protein
MKQDRDGLVSPRIHNEEFPQDTGKGIPGLMLAKVFIHDMVLK